DEGHDAHRPDNGDAAGRNAMTQRFGPPPRRTPPTRRTPPARRPSAPVRRRRRRLKLGALDGRLRYGFAAVCTLLLIVGGRLVQLQGVDHGNYANAANAQRVNTITLHAL